MKSSPLGSPAIVDPFLLLKGQSLGSKGGTEGRLSQEEKLKEAASQFEQMLLETFLKSARSSKVFGSEDELFGFNSDFYKEMQGSYLSRSIVESGKIGLQEMLLEQFKQKLGRPVKERRPGLSTPRPLFPGSLKSGAEEGGVQPQDVGSSSKTSLILPVAGRLSSAYGTRNDPFDGEQRFHKGMDIAAPAGPGPLRRLREGPLHRLPSRVRSDRRGGTPRWVDDPLRHLQESLVSDGWRAAHLGPQPLVGLRAQRRDWPGGADPGDPADGDGYDRYLNSRCRPHSVCPEFSNAHRAFQGPFVWVKDVFNMKFSNLLIMLLELLLQFPKRVKASIAPTQRYCQSFT